jgi:hypothetical protein
MSDVSWLTVKGTFKICGAECFEMSNYELVCEILTLWCTSYIDEVCHTPVRLLEQQLKPAAVSSDGQTNHCCRARPKQKADKSNLEFSRFCKIRRKTLDSTCT